MIQTPRRSRNRPHAGSAENLSRRRAPWLSRHTERSNRSWSPPPRRFDHGTKPASSALTCARPARHQPAGFQNHLQRRRQSLRTTCSASATASALRKAMNGRANIFTATRGNRQRQCVRAEPARQSLCPARASRLRPKPMNAISRIILRWIGEARRRGRLGRRQRSLPRIRRSDSAADRSIARRTRRTAPTSWP